MQTNKKLVNPDEMVDRAPLKRLFAIKHYTLSCYNEMQFSCKLFETGDMMSPLRDRVAYTGGQSICRV